jgi:hypothetical protein
MANVSVYRVLVATAAAAAFLLSAAAPAHATFHLTKIREVFPGSSTPDTAFIELQMWTDGQNLVGGHSILTYTSEGNLLARVPLTSDVPNGESQRTILVGDTAVPNRDLTYDQLWDALSTSAGGGAVCFADAEPPDCVAWGNFSGAGMLPGLIGTPVAPAGIPSGYGITRSIAPGCPTLLEPGDDTDNSAVDFALAAPTPRSNAEAPTETPCVPVAPATASAKQARKRCRKKAKRRAAESAKRKRCRKRHVRKSRRAPVTG